MKGDFGKMLESIKHVGHLTQGGLVCDQDCPHSSHKNEVVYEREVIFPDRDEQNYNRAFTAGAFFGGVLAAIVVLTLVLAFLSIS